MTARCHEDSCSIEWSEVTTLSGPAYSASVNTDVEAFVGANAKIPGHPTIQCGDDGLEVIISTSAENMLVSTAAGLLVDLPNAVVVTLSGNPTNKGVAPSANSTSPQDSDQYTWTNSTGRDALALVSGELNFNYGILGPTHAYNYAVGNGMKAGRFANSAFEVGEEPPNRVSPFNAQLAMRVLADIDAPPTTSRKAARVGIGGTIHVSTAAGAAQDRARSVLLHDPCP